jgi:hypothetical protein
VQQDAPHPSPLLPIQVFAGRHSADPPRCAYEFQQIFLVQIIIYFPETLEFARKKRLLLSF